MTDVLRDYIDARLREALLQRLAEAPWLCIFCGASGNEYEPGEPHWFPPDDHHCRPVLVGIET